MEACFLHPQYGGALYSLPGFEKRAFGAFLFINEETVLLNYLMRKEKGWIPEKY